MVQGPSAGLENSRETSVWTIRGDQTGSARRLPTFSPHPAAGTGPTAPHAPIAMSAASTHWPAAWRGDLFLFAQIYDLRLNDLHAHPIDVLKEVYRHFELEYDDKLTQRFLARIADRPTYQIGEHEYDIEDFGLTAEGVREHFADYCKRFGI